MSIEEVCFQIAPGDIDQTLDRDFITWTVMLLQQNIYLKSIVYTSTIYFIMHWSM